MFIHPKYKSGNGFDWDICLVKVTNLSNAKPSSCNNCFGAACLPRTMPDLHGRHCWVAGWGLNKEGGSTNSILNEVGVNLFRKVSRFRFSQHDFSDDVNVGDGFEILSPVLRFCLEIFHNSFEVPTKNFR